MSSTNHVAWLGEFPKGDEGGHRVVGILIRDRQKRDHVVVAAEVYFLSAILSGYYQSIGFLEEK